MVLFYNPLDLSMIAARVIFEQKTPRDSLAREDACGDFIRNISKTLMHDHQIIRRNQTLLKASRPLKLLFETSLKSMGIDVAKSVSSTST